LRRIRYLLFLIAILTGAGCSVSPRPTASPIPFTEAILSFSEENLRGHIEALDCPCDPVTQLEKVTQARDYIHAYLHSLGYAVTDQPVGNGPLYENRNVVASHIGTDPNPEQVIVIAHYDTIPSSPGADDNGSGVAVLLELARLIRPYDFARSVTFAAVTLEETGLGGSKALLSFAQENEWEISGVLVLDGIAYGGEDVVQYSPNRLTTPLPKIGDFLVVIGNRNSEFLVQDFTKSVEQSTLPLPILPMIVPGNGEDLPDSRRSDHSVFWDAGYPAILLTDTGNYRNPHYHAESDMIDTLNLAFAVQVGRAVGVFLSELAQMEE
jgi:hypothetical protein